MVQDGPKLVAPRSFTTTFEVRTNSPSIVHVEFEIPPVEFEAIDDLEVAGEPPPPPPPSPPVVQITSPTNGAQLDLMGALPVMGTVSGPGLLPTVTLNVETKLPPGSTAPPFVVPMALGGTGPTRSFSLAIGLNSLGPISLTVLAENTAALTGSASVQIFNLPQAIRQRYAASGGVTTFGEFSFGADDGSCRIAVYQSGLISVEAGITRVVTGPIFAKWLTMRDNVGRSTLGCPLAEERAALGAARAQDFRKGRVYANTPNGNTTFVPAVFVDAIDRLGGEQATGLPTGDPQSSLAVDSWLFQQFFELRGSPPVLLVERPGGDLSLLFDSGLGLTDSTATLWQQFPCTGNQGPCQVSPPIEPQGLVDAGGRCDGLTYPFGPPEWKAVLGSDYALSTASGLVQSAGISGVDFLFTHEFSNDWDMCVRPVPGDRGLLAEGSPGGACSSRMLEIEYEIYFSTFFFAQYDQVRPGDFVTATGRWIVDCGHDDYHTEIHPLFFMAYTRTEQHQGRAATAAFLWVNGFYTGDPIEVDIYPPPRPSPEASLVIEKPRDDLAAVDVQVETPALSLDHAVVRFSASPRRVEVTDAGEMIWQTGRGYSGKWFVFWSQ